MAVLVGAIFAVYANSLAGPFVFDDPLAIVENPTIRKLWPLRDVLMPPRGEGLSVEGRPILNLTLALNYAAGGTAVRGYHVVNIGIHALATLTLFGLVRRTLRLPRLRGRFGEAALPLAFVVALLWALHPLQTESVTYVIQRAEALVALFYLLTLYCFVRAAGCNVVRDTSRAVWGWQGAAAAVCLVGMATKEVMVSAPLLVLLFDRIFVAGTFRAAWRARGTMHVALFATWALLAFFVARTGTRGGTAGFGINVTPFDYALTQFEAVTRYVTLSLWPNPLIFDYGVAWVKSAADVLPYALVLGALIAGTIVAWRRWPEAAWLGLLFFAVLSPTSSIVPGNRQTLAEHRMYLPLAAIIVLGVCGVFLVGRAVRVGRALFGGALALSVAFGVLTVRRNADYRTELGLWQDTVAKRPGNGFAVYNVAKILADAGRHREAVPYYQKALPLMAHAPGVHNNLANSLAALGRTDEAMAHFEAALRAEPGYAWAHFNLANVLLQTGRKPEALEHLRAAVAADPKLIEARVNLGGVLLDLGRLPEAREQFERVLRDEPRHVLALSNLGSICLVEERWAEAIGYFEKALALQAGLTVVRERLEMARERAKR